MNSKWYWAVVPTMMTIVGLGMMHLALEAAAQAPPCSVTFTDRSGDKITSDNQGAYTDGTARVRCQVGGPNSTNIALNLGSTNFRQATRQFWGDYSGLVLGSAVVSNPPTGTYKDGWYLTIQKIANMVVGTTKITHAHFTFANGRFHWCGPSDVDEIPCGSYIPGSMAVFVTRTSLRNWLVTTDPPSVPSFVGDVAVLGDSGSSGSSIALYHMPFQLTIDCPTCP